MIVLYFCVSRGVDSDVPFCISLCRISRSPSISLLSHRGGHGKSPEKQDGGGGGKGVVGEKDSKLDGKRRKAEESVKRADVEYYQLCVRAERAR